MAEDPVEGVAGARERVDDHAARVRHPRDRGNAPADSVAEAVSRALDGGAPEQPDALRVPLGRAQPVNRYVVTVAVAVGSVALHFRELEHGVALGAEEQQLAIVFRAQVHRAAIVLRTAP